MRGRRALMGVALPVWSEIARLRLRAARHAMVSTRCEESDPLAAARLAGGMAARPRLLDVAAE